MEILIISTVLIVGILTVIGIIRANLKICQPNEVLVFSGRRHGLEDGTDIGYRVIKGGRGFRIPILETVDRLDLTTIPIDLNITNAYSKGGIPLAVRAIANVKVSSSGTSLGNAVERLMGKPRQEIRTIAQETLEGNLRGVVALLTPEEVNEDRLKFARELVSEAESDLSSLGIQLDTFKIQSVDDDRGYLDAIGRQQTAYIISAAEVREAEKEEEARVAQARANKSIAEAENEVRLVQAKLDAEAEAEEAKVGVAAKLSEARAQQELADEEIVLSEKRQRAEVVVKAEAEREAKEQRARGDAARIFEDGRAEVEILKQKLELWNAAGPDAERLFLIQMLPDILKEVIKAVDNLKIDRLTVVDGGGNGSGQGGVPAVFNQVAGATPALLESLKSSTGIDIASMLNRAAQGTGEDTQQREPSAQSSDNQPTPSSSDITTDTDA